MTQLDFLSRPTFPDIEPRIMAQFWVYHANNPTIYTMFKKFAEQIYSAGKHHYGAKAIMERLRWHYEIERKEDFKINNNFASCYARLLMFEEPKFKDFFETRNTFQ